MLGAGAAVAFLGDVLGDLQVCGKERLIVHGGEAVVAVHRLGEGAGDGLLNRVGNLLETLQGLGHTCRGRLGRAAQPNHAETNRMNVPGSEVVQVRHVGLLVVAAVAVLARVLQPGLCVGGGGQRLTLNKPRLRAAVGNPGARTLIPRARCIRIRRIANNLPVAQHLRAATGHQHRRQLTHHRAHNFVTGQAAVAVGELLLGALTGNARGNHERRVRHYQVEKLTGDRLQQGTLTQVHARLRVLRVNIECLCVQQQVKTGERQGTLRNVGGGHVLSVGEQVEGLNTAAGAHIQGTLDGGTLGNLRQSQGGVANAEHVILTEHSGALMRTQVGGNKDFGAVIGGVRAKVNARRPAGRIRSVALNQRGILEVNQGIAENLGCLRLSERASQQEKRQQTRQVLLTCTVTAAQNMLHTPQARNHLVTSHRLSRLNTEQLLHSVIAVVQRQQAFTDAGQAGVIIAAGSIRNGGVLGSERGGRNSHAHHSTHPPHQPGRAHRV